MRSTDVAWFGAGKRTVMLGSDRPMDLPSVEALQMAADALSRHYVLPETMQHPAIRLRPSGLPIRSWCTAWPRRGRNLRQRSRRSAMQQSSAGRIDRPRDTGHHISNT